MRIELKYNKENYNNCYYAGKSVNAWMENVLEKCQAISTNCRLELEHPLPLLNVSDIEKWLLVAISGGYKEVNFQYGRVISPNGNGCHSIKLEGILIPSDENNPLIEQAIYEDIALSHIKRGVYILSPSSVFIDATAILSKGVKIYGYTHIKGDSIIGEGSEIFSSEIHSSSVGCGVRIRHSVIEESFIDDGCKIGPFAYIRPKTNLGKNVRVGDFVEIKQSELGSGVKTAHLTYIGNAKIGDNTNIGCGTVFANYDGKNKNTATVGRNVFIGCNTNLIAPITVGDGCFIAAGSTITEDMPTDSFGIARARQVTKREKPS